MYIICLFYIKLNLCLYICYIHKSTHIELRRSLLYNFFYTATFTSYTILCRYLKIYIYTHYTIKSYKTCSVRVRWYVQCCCVLPALIFILINLVLAVLKYFEQNCIICVISKQQPTRIIIIIIKCILCILGA